MKIAVLAANGKVGKLIVAEALKKNYDVTAVVRGENQSEAQNVIKKDILDLTYDDLKDFDVIINAVGFWTEETLKLHKVVMEHLIYILKGKPNRLMIVGGAASLYVDENKTLTLLEAEGFPEEYKPVAINMKAAFDVLKETKDVNWTYFSPAADFDDSAPYTGKYILGEDNFFVNDKGESKISYADYALAMVDEIANGKFKQKRFTAIGNY